MSKIKTIGIFTYLIAGLLSLGAACAVDEIDAEETQDGVTTRVLPDESIVSPSSGESLCSIDYYCPTNGFEISGFANGNPTPSAAYRKCKEVCDVPCETGDWVCY